MNCNRPTVSLAVAVGLAIVNWTPFARADYANGAAINISASRGTTASAVGTLQGDLNSPRYQPPLMDLRLSPGSTNGGASLRYQLDFPKTFKVQSYDLKWHTANSIVPVDYSISTYTTAGGWEVRTNVTGNAVNVNTGSFAQAFDASKVRIDVTKTLTQGSSYDWIINLAAFYGPNSTATDTNISLTQSTWAGATITSGYDALINGAGDYSPNLAGQHAIEVILNGKYKIEKLGFTVAGGRTPQNIDVYAWDGGAWQIISQIRGMGTSVPYYEYAVAPAQQYGYTTKLKYDILDTGTDLRIGELWAYGKIVPPRGSTFIVQ